MRIHFSAAAHWFFLLPCRCQPRFSTARFETAALKRFLAKLPHWRIRLASSARMGALRGDGWHSRHSCAALERRCQDSDAKRSAKRRIAGGSFGFAQSCFECLRPRILLKAHFRFASANQRLLQGSAAQKKTPRTRRLA
jgi:hypothetical protein